jgi:hypothetical protein
MRQIHVEGATLSLGQDHPICFDPQARDVYVARGRALGFRGVCPRPAHIGDAPTESVADCSGTVAEGER